MKPTVYFAGHAHIDAEWLWTIEETIEVCRETFANMVRLMKKHPDFTFIQSSSLYYLLMERKYPELFREIKHFVEKGNWKPVGSSIVEFDAQIQGGESFIRQILYGSKYFEEKFGIFSKTLWLPDSFGFPSSLPKLAKGCGMEYFATQKLHWSDTTEFPYYLFKWESEDGSRIIGLHLPGSYVDRMFSFKPVLENLKKMIKRHKIPMIIEIYGIGDHGGGPLEEEVENIERWIKEKKNFVLKFSGIDEFMDDVKKFEDKFPLVKGELYLEFHRGVFTTGAWLKYFNRKNEALLMALEKAFIIAKSRNIEYPKELIDAIWFVYLINQFHDILCMTVIEPSYLKAIRRQLRVYKITKKLIKKALESAYKGSKTCVFNPLSWRRDAYVIVDSQMEHSQKIGDKYLVYVRDLPPVGFKELKPSKPNDEVHVKETRKGFVLENKYLRVIISKATGRVISIFSKEIGKDAIRAPITLRIHDDYPVLYRRGAVVWDAWEVYFLDGFNRKYFKDLKNPQVVKLVENGPLRARILVRYIYKQRFREPSTIDMYITLYAGVPYVLFEFEVDWTTWHRLLKMYIPLNVNSDEAEFEVPYGATKRLDIRSPRATKHDRAKHEVPGHRWVTVEENDFGVAILDDSKYGYTFFNRTIAISLLRSPTFASASMMNPKYIKFKRFRLCLIENLIKIILHSVPGLVKRFFDYPQLINTLIMEAVESKPMDYGRHVFKIAVMPFKDKKIVYKYAVELNNPVHLFNGEGEFSLLSVEPNHVEATAVKLSEDGKYIVVRIYNHENRETEAKLTFYRDAEFFESNHIEKGEKPLGRGKEISLKLRPREIKTIKIKL